MVKLIVGKKGSGKTKLLIESVNHSAQVSKGYVVCLADGLELRYDLSKSVKLVDIHEYGIKGYDELYGFLSGIIVGNYDVTDVYVDGIFKFCDRDYQETLKFFDRLAVLAAHGTKFVFTVSAEPAELPIEISKYID